VAPHEDRSDAPAEDAKGSAPGFPFKVKQFQIKDGKLDYADLSLRPRFAADIHGLNGMIVGLSSDAAGMAALELKGRVGEYGSADIEGELHPFDIRRHSDVKLSFENMEMADFTPYSAKFAGRKIQSGKMTAEIDYQVRDSKLRGENRVVLDKLLLGERVESAEAPNLPLDLALALLKDADGRIDLDLPVTGDLDHPEFSLGHLVWKAFLNLVEKVVTAPFRAIGHLLGIDHEGLDRILFAAGSAEIPPPESEKLAALAKALLERPQLALKVQGRYQPDSDGNALKILAVKQAVYTGLGYTPTPGEDPGPLDYTDPSTRAILDSMAIQRLGAEAVAELRERFTLPAEATAASEAPAAAAETKTAAESVAPDPIAFYHELFSRVAAEEALDEEALSALARQRADAIIGEMVSAGGVDRARCSALEVSAAEKGEQGTVAVKLDLAAHK
jgi:hypothetical protein